MASVLSSDGKQDPDVMAANATSAALMLSDIPWGGPIGVIRIGRINGQFVVNPTMDEVITVVLDCGLRSLYISYMHTNNACPFVFFSLPVCCLFLNFYAY